MPIDGEAGVGYILRSGFDLPPLMFTRDELAALTLGARFVKAWGGARLALAAEEALVKIEAVLPEKERRAGAETNLFAMSFSLPDETRRVIDQLDVAIRDRRRVHIVYDALDGETSERDLRPLGLYHWGKVWTLAAWCELRTDFRNFRADRITDDRRLRRHVSPRARQDAAGLPAPHGGDGAWRPAPAPWSRPDIAARQHAPARVASAGVSERDSHHRHRPGPQAHRLGRRRQPRLAAVLRRRRHDPAAQDAAARRAALHHP